MSKHYKKSKLISKLSQYFQDKDCKNLYKDGCINYLGITSDTKENYTKVIVDYLIEHIAEFEKQLINISVTRRNSYKTASHIGKSDFDFNKNPSGERREEKIAHAMYCQYKDVPAEFGKILDYQIPLKNKREDKGLGKIDLLSVKEDPENESKKIYFLELKRDGSKETLLRCILEAYTYSKIIDKDRLCGDFDIPHNNKKDCKFVIAPLVYKNDNFENQLEYVKPLIEVLGCSVEIFVWDYKDGKYEIETMGRGIQA